MVNWTLDNPVVTKELRGRMRGARTYWLLFGYLFLLSLLFFFWYLGWWSSHANAMQNGAASAGFTAGRMFFKVLFYAQAVMIALITPALTAGGISVEREQRTFEMLRSTVLKPRSIVWGKLVSSVSFVVLLLTSSLPLLSLCFLLGGVSPGEVFFAYVLLAGDALLFGAIGLCWSAYAANTATATVLSYATLIVFFVATFPFAIPALDDGGNVPFYGLCALNPVGAVTGAVMPEHYFGWTLPAWVPALLLNGTLSLLLVLACINCLEDYPARRASALRLVTLLFAGLILFFGEGMVLGVGPMVGSSSYALAMLALAIPCTLLLLFVPVLVTGDREDWNSAANWPLRVFRSAALPSGLPFALLLTALVVGITFLASHLAYQPAAVPIRGIPFPGRPSGPIGFANASYLLDMFQQAGLMLLGVVIGIAGVGYLLSVLLGNRWSSLTLLYVGLLLAVALPFFSYANLNGSDARAAASSPAINTLFFCPYVPLVQISDPLGRNSGFKDTPIPGMAGYGAVPLWVGTGGLYLTLGLVSYGVAFLVVRRKKVRSEGTGGKGTGEAKRAGASPAPTG